MNETEPTSAEIRAAIAFDLSCAEKVLRNHKITMSRSGMSLQLVPGWPESARLHKETLEAQVLRYQRELEAWDAAQAVQP